MDKLVREGMIFGLKFRVIHFHVPIIHMASKYIKELLISPTLSPCTPYLRFIYIYMCVCDRARSQRYIRAITGHCSSMIYILVHWFLIRSCG